jgi:hypothetical protein
MTLWWFILSIAILVVTFVASFKSLSRERPLLILMMSVVLFYFGISTLISSVWGEFGATPEPLSVLAAAAYTASGALWLRSYFHRTPQIREG